MKLYAVRVELTRWADVHVVAESEDSATELAIERAREILDDCDADEDALAEVSEARDGWQPGELPYLDDAAEEIEGILLGSGDHDCDQWSAALERIAPVVDTQTLPLVLPYSDGRVEVVPAALPLPGDGDGGAT